MAYAPSEDSDQPGHMPSLFRVFAVHMKKAWVLCYPLSAQQRLLSDWADAQADLSLHWAHMPFCWFCHEACHICKSIDSCFCIYSNKKKRLPFSEGKIGQLPTNLGLSYFCQNFRTLWTHFRNHFVPRCQFKALEMQLPSGNFKTEDSLVFVVQLSVFLAQIIYLYLSILLYHKSA